MFESFDQQFYKQIQIEGYQLHLIKTSAFSENNMDVINDEKVDIEIPFRLGK